MAVIAFERGGEKWRAFESLRRTSEERAIQWRRFLRRQSITISGRTLIALPKRWDQSSPGYRGAGVLPPAKQTRAHAAAAAAATAAVGRDKKKRPASAPPLAGDDDRQHQRDLVGTGINRRVFWSDAPMPLDAIW